MLLVWFLLPGSNRTSFSEKRKVRLELHPPYRLISIEKALPEIEIEDLKRSFAGRLKTFLNEISASKMTD